MVLTSHLCVLLSSSTSIWGRSGRVENRWELVLNDAQYLHRTTSNDRGDRPCGSSAKIDIALLTPEALLNHLVCRISMLSKIYCALMAKAIFQPIITMRLERKLSQPSQQY